MTNTTFNDREDAPESTITPEQAETLRTVLDEITTQFKQFVVLPRCGPETISLFVICTWLIEVTYYAPLLVLKSPEMRCGKTTTLDLITSLVRKPVTASNCSSAALYRLIAKEKPTFVWDEFDSFLRAGSDRAEEVRNILNSGYRNDSLAFVCRAGSKQSGNAPERFNVFGYKVLAGIGSLPSTLQDRAIQVTMRRKRSDEFVERLRMDRQSKFFQDLSARCETVASEIKHALRFIDPETPEGLTDREKDNWQLMLAVADLAEGLWPQTARKAAIKLSVGEEVDSSPVQLLSDIQSFFRSESNSEFAPTKQLLNYLYAIETRPWGAWGWKEDLMTARQLAALLEPFGIKPTQRKTNGTPIRGYDRSSFSDAFDRYCYTPSNADSPLPNGDKLITVDDLQGNGEGNGSIQQPLPDQDGEDRGNGTNRDP